ncbi:MAG: LysR family transcriptional regulator [Alphaproteobacteria bacterium]|jgi:DNA-binding transcriptional LysR family regulator|nr:LysR family transcriptional regulator [Alphaproteobacteria bacterium]
MRDKTLTVVTPGKALPRLKFKLEELETFLAVAESGSFSRAAEMLGLSQPSITSRVQRLEDMLGMALFSRTTRRIALTDAGERLQTTGNATLRDLRILLDTFRGEAEIKKRRVTIAAPPMLSAVVLLPIIRRYMQSHGQTEVKLHDLPAGPALAELTDGTADMAIMVLDGHHPEFKFESLTIEECAVVRVIKLLSASNSQARPDSRTGLYSAALRAASRSRLSVGAERGASSPSDNDPSRAKAETTAGRAVSYRQTRRLLAWARRAGARPDCPQALRMRSSAR